MIELRTAVSHRNRDARSISAIFPPLVCPKQIFSKERRFNRIISKSASGSKTNSFVSFKWILHPKNPDLESPKITPTLINSSRSTRGTSRMMAYSYKRSPCILGFFGELIGIRKSKCQKLGVNLTQFLNVIGISAC